MEHWQFLIQRQGDRSWQSLGSPNIEILEGEYRVLARSNLPNTVVEVRVTHSSTQEVPPKRKVFKRSRHTNSEGLMAVIPFTYFEPGVWELRCSGDLMSDLFGKAWQYSVQLQVLSQAVVGEPERLESGNNAVEAKISPLEDSLRLLPALRFAQSQLQEELIIKINQLLLPPSSRESVEVNTVDHPDTVVDENLVSATVAEPIIATHTHLVTTDLPVVTKKIDQLLLPPAKQEVVQANAVDRSDTVIEDEDNLVFATVAEPIIATHTHLVTTGLPVVTKDEDAANNQPVSPVWLKGETAEQILQNLIEIALPASESLLEDATVADSPVTQPPPLQLTLSHENYVAHWGQVLTINGQVTLKDNTNHDLDETLSLESLCTLELGVELHSPLESEILYQVRQALPDKLLPLTIKTSIDIPAEYKSKLILGDIRLYGTFTNVNEGILLASQSFTITADVTELLAITAAAKTPKSLNDSSTLSNSQAAFTESESPVSLDLKLLNLVKSLKTNLSLTFTPSPNNPLPASILREATLREAGKKLATDRSPQLPKLPPPSQTSDIAITDVIAELPNQEESGEKDNTVAAINMEQLVIKHRRVPILDNTFPYLKRLKTSPVNKEEVESNSNALDALATEDENAAELVTDITHSQEQSVAEEVASSSTELIDESIAEEVASSSAELIRVNNAYSSPLIRKWMNSQGQPSPENIKLQYQDTYFSLQQKLLVASVEPEIVGVNVPLSLDVDTDSSLVSDLEAKDSESVLPQTSELWGTQEDINTVQEKDLETLEDAEVENESKQASQPLSVPIKTSSAWLAQEIVVEDDTYSELETNTTRSYPSQQEEQPLSNLSSLLPKTTDITEPLAIPRLYVPEGELIAGKSIKVRVEIPNTLSQIAVKLWVEDYQTRWLLDGPHLLINLLPNSSGGLEVITQLSIPFGCLEVRLEAIALDMTTQQESHKITIVRAVIPPDLPNLQLDQLMGF